MSQTADERRLEPDADLVAKYPVLAGLDEADDEQRERVFNAVLGTIRQQLDELTER